MAEFPPHPELNVTTIYLLLGRLEEKVDQGFSGVHGRLDKLNGKVAEHAAELAVLKDRSEQAMEKAAGADEMATTAKSRSAWLGPAAAGAIAAASELFKRLWGGQ